MPGRLAGDPWMNARGEQRGARHRHWRAATNQKTKPLFDARRPCWFLTTWRARLDGSVKRGLSTARNRSGSFPTSVAIGRFVTRQELCRRAPAGLVLEIDVCQRGSAAVADEGQASVSAARQGGGKRRSGRLKALPPRSGAHFGRIGQQAPATARGYPQGS